MHPPGPFQSSQPASDPPGRRRALVILINSVLGVMGGTLGALLGAFALRPARRAAGDRWVRAASFVELTPGNPLTRVLSVPRADGWYRERVRQTVFLVRDGDHVRALSATCTHLGCQVRWDRDRKRFLCPCHGGEYDAQGRVIAGPPPRPLDTIEARVDAADDSVLVRV
jgi:quinol---cytochrome c reductase iron-sulfur subunit, bacillus type